MKKNQLKAAGLLAVALCVIAGCATSNVDKGKSGSKVSSFFSWHKPEPPTPLYLDFSDVLIPGELKLIKKSSFVFSNPSQSGGVLALKGPVEINSLVDFFRTNMAKDNWKEVTAFKSWRSIILFKKENRWCVINITEKDLNTYVDIWVAPTTGSPDSGLLKSMDLQ